jgi:anti-sigma-K factor RskA
MDLSGSRHPQCGEDVAPYALGALSPADARAFEQHLEACELCRADLASLRPVIDVLPETPDQLDPPPELRRRVMAVVEEEAAERRRSVRERRPRRSRSWLPRPLPALAAACVLLVAGLGVSFALRDDGSSTVAPVSAPEGVRASLHVDDGSGRLELHGMDAPPAGKVMQVWLMRDPARGPVATDALFTPNRSGDASVAVPGDLKGVTRVLVSVEPAGGSRSPTTAPALDFQLQST